MHIRTRLAAGILALMCLLPSAVFASTCPSLSRTLSRNAEGSDVFSLQHFLADWGLLDRAYVIGVFGLKTERAVQAFQTQYGVVTGGTPETTGFGTVGARTRIKITAVCAQGPSRVSTSSQTNRMIPSATVQTVPPVQSAETPQQVNVTPRLEIGDVSGESVMVRFYAMPPQTVLFMIDPVTKARLTIAGYSPVERGGNGYIAYPLLAEFAGKTYMFVAQASTTNETIVTSASFTIPTPKATDEVGMLSIYDGQVFLYSAANVTRAGAEYRCRLEKTSHPGRNTQCTFNGYTMFVQ